MSMKLSTGKVAFPIEFDNGDKDCIYFNPNDPNLPIRLSEMQNNVTSRIKEFDDVIVGVDGKPEDNATLENFKKLQEIIFEELDTAFGGSVSSIVFKHCSPFAIVDGDYFFFQFINAIKPEIEKKVKKANAEIEKKMAKHIDKYKK